MIDAALLHKAPHYAHFLTYLTCVVVLVVVFLAEFHPNMVISRCHFNRRVTAECYGEDTLNLLGSRIIISSGAALGTRDAVIAWSHHLTLQLQEAPGRLEETRCVSGGIDHAFINWLSYNNKVGRRAKPPPPLLRLILRFLCLGSCGT